MKNSRLEHFFLFLFMSNKCNMAPLRGFRQKNCWNNPPAITERLTDKSTPENTKQQKSARESSTRKSNTENSTHLR